MAEIRTSISIGDSFTPNLRKLQRGLASALTTYESLAKAFGKPLTLKVSKSVFTKLNSETVELNKNQSAVNQALNRAPAAFQRAANGAYAAATAYSRFNRVAQALKGTLTSMPRGRMFTIPKTSNAQAGAGYNFGGNATNRVKNINAVAKATDNLTRKQRLFNTSIVVGNSLHAKFTSGLKSIAGAYLAFQAALKAMTLSDELANLRGGFNLITPDRQMDFDQYLKDVSYIAKETRTGIFQTGDMLKRMALNTGDIFKNADGTTNMNELYGFTATFQKMLRMGNLRTSERDSAILQFTQAMGAGVLQGDEFRSISENAPLIKKAVADYMGVSTGALKELSSEGKITSEIMKGAILSMVDEVDAKMKLLPRTFADAWTDFKNNATMAFNEVLKKLGEFSDSKTLVEIIDAANIGLMLLAKGVMLAIDGIQGLYKLIKNNLDIIAPPLILAAGAMLAFAAATMYARWCTIAETAVTWLSTTAKIAYAAATRGFGVAARFAAIQQRSLTAAILANPIGRIIALVFGLITLIYAGIVAWKKYSGETASVFSMIVGGFGVVVEFVKTAGKSIYYSLAWAWYAIKADFWTLASVLDEGWNSLANSIANAMIGAVNLVLTAWNKLISWLPDKVKTELGLKTATLYDYHANDYVSPWRKNASDAAVTRDEYAKKNLENVLDFSVKDSFDKWQKKARDLEKYFDIGELTKELKDALGIAEDATKPYDTQALSDKYGKTIADNTGEIAKNTGNLDITSEELVWLREIGERDAVNKFTTAQVNVDMKNQNTIGNNLDINQIFHQLTEKIREGVLTAADGVHN